MQKIVEKHIQNNLEIACVDEKTCKLSKLVAYKVKFPKYRYDQLSSKLIETKGGARVSQITIVELILIYVGIKSELVFTIIEVLTQMQGGFDFAIVHIDPLAIIAST